MKDALDQLLFEVRRERRVQARERREARAIARHKIPPPEAQGKPERWHATRYVLLLHISGAVLGIYQELHHEVHPEWRRLVPSQSFIWEAEETVEGSGWFPQEPVTHLETEVETIALRERFLELLNAAEAEHYPRRPAEDGDPRGSPNEAGPLSLLAG